MNIWEKIIAGLFVTLFALVPLIWLPWTSELFEFNKLMATYVIAALIAGAWAIRCIIGKQIIFKRTLLDIPLLVFLGSSILSLLGSIDIHTSWYGYYSRWNGGLLSLLTYSFLYWAFVSNMTRRLVVSSIKYYVLSAIIISIYGAFEHFGRSASCYFVTGNFDVACWVQDVQNRVYATLGQPNWMGAYLVALIFIPLSKIINNQGSSPKENKTNKLITDHWALIINAIIFSLLFCALLFTKSRSGMLAFGISSILFWGMYFIHLGQLEIKSIRNFLLFVFGVLSLTFIIPNPVRDLVFRPTVIQKTVGPALEVGGTESGSIRKIVWTGATRIWTSGFKNFMIGTGPETFAQAYYQYRPIEHNQTSEWELLYNKAHNEFLNQLATTGILGFISYIILLVGMTFIFIKSQIQNFNNQINYKKQVQNDLDPRILNLGFFCGWLSISVTNFWGFSVVIMQLFLFLLPAISIVLSAQEEEKSAQRNDLNYYQVFGIFGIILTTGYLILNTYWYWQADAAYATGSNAFRGFQASQDPQYLLTSYRGYYQAFLNNSSEPAIMSDFSLSAAYLAVASRNNSTDAAQLANQSLALSQVAIVASPHHPNYYKNRARSLILLSELDPAYLTQATKTMKAAQIISPTDPRIPYYLGVILKSQGATDEAKLYFQQALDLKSDFADAQGQLK